MYYVGLDIGGTKCAATLGEFTDVVPKIIDKKFFLTNGKTPELILNEFSLFIEEKIKTFLKPWLYSKG